MLNHQTIAGSPTLVGHKRQDMEHLQNFVSSVIRQEKAVLEDLAVEQKLLSCTRELSGLKKFAESFYFIRYDFCRLCFIVGERCGSQDFLWRGLVDNLNEELGGKKGPSHNHLYAEFLDCVGAATPSHFREPAFAREFNLSWESFCRNASLQDALSAMAIYEILDQPDYRLLFRVLQLNGLSSVGLRFFRVHAESEHFTLFKDVMCWLNGQESGQEAIANALRFVLTTQRQMWAELLNYLGESTQSVPSSPMTNTPAKSV